MRVHGIVAEQVAVQPVCKLLHGSQMLLQVLEVIESGSAGQVLLQGRRRRLFIEVLAGGKPQKGLDLALEPVGFRERFSRRCGDEPGFAQSFESFGS